jgi:acyl-CoA thioesterase FadM
MAFCVPLVAFSGKFLMIYQFDLPASRGLFAKPVLRSANQERRTKQERVCVMPRIKLAVQKEYPFTCEVLVRVGDLNYGAHVGNSEMVGILHDARVALFRSMGISEGDLGDGKTGIVMDDLVVNFRSEAFLGDTLNIGCVIEEVGEAGFRIHYHVTKGEKSVAVAETGLVGFNYTTRRIALLPSAFKEKALAARQ